MRRIEWKKMWLAVMSGGVMFQMVGCVETAAVVTSLATTATAGGLFYLIYRVLQE